MRRISIQRRLPGGFQQVRQMIKGNLSPVIKRYKDEMNYYAEELQFEKAAFIKKKIEGLENYQARSVIVSKSISNIDVFSILREKNTAYINYLMVQNGTIIQTHTISLEPKLDETDEEILSLAIIDLRDKFKSEASEIVIPFEIEFESEGIVVTIPKLGDKKKLLRSF